MFSVCYTHTHNTHTHTHARTHAPTHARARTHTHTPHTKNQSYKQITLPKDWEIPRDSLLSAFLSRRSVVHQLLPRLLPIEEHIPRGVTRCTFCSRPDCLNANARRFCPCCCETGVRQRERQTDRQTDTQRETETERQKGSHRETARDTQRMCEWVCACV